MTLITLVSTPKSNAPTSSAPEVAPPPHTGSSKSRLEEFLSLVPLGFSGDDVVFSDYAIHRNATGTDRGSDDGTPFVPEGAAIHEVFRANVNNINELIGLDPLAFDVGIWSWQPEHQSDTFLLFQGQFDRNATIRKITKLGYAEERYLETVYYNLGDDFTFDRTHPLRRLGLSLNRVVILDDRLLAAPATRIINSLIATQQGAASSILDSTAHRALVTPVGDGLVSGALIPAQWVLDNWNTVNTRPVARLDRYREGPEAWGSLASYTTVLFGYQVQGESEQIIVAFYYPDNAAAAAQELEDRWNTFHYDPSGPLSDIEETPVTRSCSPLSTTVIRRSDHSILVGACPVTKKNEDDPTVKGPGLWWWLLSTRELQFLAQNPEALE